jgi:hypothetical protein
VAGASENPEAVEAADLRVNDPAEFVDLLGDIART